MAQMDLQNGLQNQQPGQWVGFVIVPSKDSTAVVVVSTYNLMDGKYESTGCLYLTSVKSSVYEGDNNQPNTKNIRCLY